jgi:hypothetical protein
LGTADFGRLMRIFTADVEYETERTTLIHPYTQHRCPGGGLPSSGSMVSLKFKRSSGFGKKVFMVFGNESSVKSKLERLIEWRHLSGRGFAQR